VALVVVKNSTVDFPEGSGSTRTLRADTDDDMEGLKQLAEAIQQEGTLACLQINHTGRFAVAAKEAVAPSAVETFGRLPKSLDQDGIEQIIDKFAQAAVRSKTAGFDIVELHGGAGYLLSQFLSPKTNKRTDE
jgi:2,4-dienoyl-CoA reductase (NADPH2)